jgi:hypothetical protein
MDILFIEFWIELLTRTSPKILILLGLCHNSRSSKVNRNKKRKYSKNYKMQIQINFQTESEVNRPTCRNSHSLSSVWQFPSVVFYYRYADHVVGYINNGGLPVGFTGLVKLDLQAVKLNFCWENRFTAFKNSFTGGCKIDGKTSNASRWHGDKEHPAFDLPQQSPYIMGERLL